MNNKKTKIIIFLTLLLVTVLCGLSIIGCFFNNSKVDVSNSTSYDIFSSEKFFKIDSGFSTDLEYIEKKQTSKSNSELTNLNEKFSEIWKQKAQVYYHKILEYCESKENTELAEEIQTAKDNWEKYYIIQMDYYENCMSLIYAGGSIVPVKLSNYSRILYRNRAIELYDMCNCLLIKTDSP